MKTLSLVILSLFCCNLFAGSYFKVESDKGEQVTEIFVDKDNMKVSTHKKEVLYF